MPSWNPLTPCDPFPLQVRFVEDNWESPVLGAWGLGWEVSHPEGEGACSTSVPPIAWRRFGNA